MKNLSPLSISVLIVALVLIVFSFFLPGILTMKSSHFDFTETGQIGDTIGGVMSPIVGIAGVLLTFIAFYIQFKANQLQKEQFRTELNEQKLQFKKNQFENQFYEMLNIHKENVNSVQVSNTFGTNLSNWNESTINGRQAFDYLLTELEIAISLSKKHFPDQIINDQINEAYSLFFHGVRKKQQETHAFYSSALELKGKYYAPIYSSLYATISNYCDHDEDRLNPIPRYNLFEGHSNQLAHYYRHLFQTVKFVVYQEKSFISYEEKRNYLRILRAQLSNTEQAHLFYNWMSNFGNQWESETNRFFSDYRMIHNIYNDLLVEGISLNEIFNLNGEFLKEENRENDPLFEFQDW